MRISKALALEEKLYVHYGNNCHWLSQFHGYLLNKCGVTVSVVARVSFGNWF